MRSLDQRSAEPSLEEEVPPELLPPLPPRKAARRPPHMRYTKFDGILLSPSPSMDLGPHCPGRKVCMDNLPIDVTEAEIRDAVSFFGPAANVTIYNQRLDLDPGEDSMPKQRPKKAGYWANTLDKEIRKETPVYAFVEFSDDGALERSYTDNVRIFGVVIRQHCSRVSLASEFDTLYLEIPANEERKEGEEPQSAPFGDGPSPPPSSTASRSKCASATSWARTYS